MGLEIVPKFGEIQLFAFSASVAVAFLLYINPATLLWLADSLIHEAGKSVDSAISYAFVGLLFAWWLYSLYLSIKYALSDETPSPSEAGMMVASILLPLTVLSLGAGGYWYAELSKSDSAIDRLMIVFPALELARGFIILALARMHKINYREKFDYKNAGKYEVAAASAVLLATGLFCRFLTGYSPVLVILMMYEFANIAAGVVGGMRPRGTNAISPAPSPASPLPP